MAHAKWSPSSAHRWMECFASMAEELPYIRVSSSVFADEGTAAHAVLEWTLRDPLRTTYGFPHETLMIETKDDDGAVVCANLIEIGTEMRDFIQEVVDDVREYVRNGWTLYVEQRVGFSETIKAHPKFIEEFGEQFGTADIILISADGTVVIVADLKYGMGNKVFAKENHQMLSYGVGTLETFDGLLGDFEKFVLKVYQPRLGHIDEWETTRAKVAEHGQKMRIAAENNLSVMRWMVAGKTIGSQWYKPSEKTCQWCKAKAQCKKLEESVMREMLDEFEDLDAPLNLEAAHATLAVSGTVMPAGERLGQAFANLELIETWCKAVRAECDRQVLQGMTIIGVDGLPLKAIESKKGNRTWINAEIAEGMLVGAIGDKAYKPREILTPSAADKILNKKATRETWKAFVENITQAPGRPKVVLGSTEGEPYSGAMTDGEFEEIQE